MSQNHSTDITGEIVNSLSSPEEETRRMAVVSLSSVPLEKCSEFLFRAMGDGSWRVRKEAVEVFVSSPDAERFLDVLFELLGSQDNAGLRNSAAEALIRLGKSSLSVLEPHVRDEDDDVRKFVVDILGAIGDPSAVRLLVRALDDGDPNVATSAAENLGNIGSVEALSPLLSTLSRNDMTLRFTILEALGKIGEPLPFETLKPFLSEGLLRKAVYECLGSVGGVDAVPFLIKGLSETGRSVREASVKSLMAIRERSPEKWAENGNDALLREVGGTSVVEGLLSLLEGADLPLSRDLICLFGLIGDPRTAGAILRSCRNENLLPHCIPSLRALGAVTVDFLEEEFFKADEVEKTNIVCLCGEMGMGAAAPMLRRALDEPSPHVREASVRAVGGIGLTELIPDVAFLLNDFDQDVRAAALETLALLADRDAPSVDQVAVALSVADDPDKRRDAAYLFAVLRNGERLSLLMKDPDDLVRRTAVQGGAVLEKDDALHHLTMSLTDEDSGVRIAAATTLGEIGREDAVEPLILVLADSDPWVRCAALRSLGKIGGKEASKAIENTFDAADGLVSLAALDALRHFDTDGSRELARKATAHADGEVVKLALEILIKLNDPWLGIHGEEFLRHAQWDVRSAIVRYLAERRGREALSLLRNALEKETDDLVRDRIVEILERFR